MDYYKADKSTGGFCYEVIANYKDIDYYLECIPQFELIPKNMWNKQVEMKAKIQELLNNDNKSTL